MTEDLYQLENSLIKEWAHHTMEKRKGHKVYNFCCKFKISIFNTYIVFNCSGDDNEPNGYIYMDTFQIDADNLTTTIRDYQLSKLI